MPEWTFDTPCSEVENQYMYYYTICLCLTVGQPTTIYPGLLVDIMYLTQPTTLRSVMHTALVTKLLRGPEVHLKVILTPMTLSGRRRRKTETVLRAYQTRQRVSLNYVLLVAYMYVYIINFIQTIWSKRKLIDNYVNT